MIAVGAVLAVIALMAAPPPDPCALDPGNARETSTRPDPSAARAYRDVGDEERAAGDVVAATIAYREALRLSPRDSRARSALAALCVDRRHARNDARATDTGGGFDEGLRLMEAGDRTRAIAAFEAIRSSGADPSAALLEGICEYELGNDPRARSLLLEAKNEPEVAGTALFFLGLIALRAGDASDASSLLASAEATDSRLSANASDVLRLARRDGRVILSMFSEAGVDSNVELTPDGTATNAGSADGYAMGAMSVFARPYGGLSGPYLRAAGQYRQQVRIAAYNLGDVTGAVGARAVRGGKTVVAEYAYDFLVLGQAAYLSAHRLLGTGRMPLGPFSMGVTYFARFESFLSAGTSGYSGLRHNVEGQGDWRAGPRSSLLLGYHLGRDATNDAALGYWEHGPFAGVRLNPLSALRLGAEGRLTLRRYDTVDPDLGVERADRYFDGAVLGEVDVSDRWMLRIVGTARRALSNIPEFQYTKVTGSIGLVYVAGVL